MSSLHGFKCSMYELDELGELDELDATVEHSFETKYYAILSTKMHADMPHFPLHVISYWSTSIYVR